MANQKKFGAFAGVFTPSLLTILGVIMYMRLGWVVGNAGLIGTIAIIVIAHVISITTGLSISSIATDKKVGAGGVYYVLSRSLGLPIGGAIGVTLFVGTAMSIALYLIGFAESFNPYFGLDASINGLRMGGSLALLSLAILALISTSLALKAQFFIMAAIVCSLVSIFFGVSPQVPETLAFLPPSEGLSMEVIFAVFFPAVTGFTAGIAMSGDLKDPKKSIPLGTLWAIGVGFVVYIALAVFLFYTIDGGLLRSDNNIMLKLALFAPAVVAGIWGATLSSALGGILGAPRILQAMSVDKITPNFFATGVGKGNDPRNALLLTVLIAEAGILIGELDTIARVCSMFYLAAYGFINLSFYLESWASSDFNPTFRVKKWVGLIGFIATFVVMFRLDMIAMVVAFIVIGGIYFWLAKKQLALGSGDVWQSVWSSVVKTGLRRMDEKQDHKRNWKPNVLLFSGGTNQRSHLLEFSKELVGNRGIVTNFDLHENQEAALLFPKHQQSVTDELLKQYGVFGRRIEVKNIFKGIETIASTFGFSGIEPNTILMGWAKNTADPIWFAQMTQKLIDLDYNVLYLDYDWRFGFRKYQQIDLWWRGFGNNAELMLNISKFLLASNLWRNAQIRVLLVEDTNSNKKVIEKKIKKILEERRIVASVKVIGNAVDKRPLYELMKVYSSETDLILVGIPAVKLEEAQNFVSRTNDLVGTIGTTLLVKASTQFGEVQVLTPNTVAVTSNSQGAKNQVLPDVLAVEDVALATAVSELQFALDKQFSDFVEEVFSPIQEKYLELYHLTLTEIKGMGNEAETDKEEYQEFSQMLDKLQLKLKQIRQREIPILSELFSESNREFGLEIEQIFDTVPKKIKVTKSGKTQTIKLRKIAAMLQSARLTPAFNRLYLTFGNDCFENLSKTIGDIISKTYHLFEIDGFTGHTAILKPEMPLIVAELTELLVQQMSFFQDLKMQMEFEGLSLFRNFSNEIITISQDPDTAAKLKAIKLQTNKRNVHRFTENIAFFPSNWSNNQNVLHTSLETNLELAQVNLLINEGICDMLKTLDQEVNRPIEEQFSGHVTTMQKVIEEFDGGLKTQSIEDFDVHENQFIGIDRLINLIVKQMEDVPSMVDYDAVLMSKTLVEDFEDLQMEGILPTNLDLSKIVDFILETKLNGPIYNHIEHYLAEASNIYYNQINSVNLLKYSLRESKKQQEIKELLQTVRQKFEHENELFKIAKIRFEEDIRAILYDLQMELDSRFLVENADNWNRFINVSKREKGIARIKNRVNSQINGIYTTLNKALTAKKYESDVSLFEFKYQLKNNVEQGLIFVNAMYPKAVVAASLPFYYKQLFQGKQLPVQQNYLGRERELTQYKNANMEGRNSVVLIVGKSLVGKSHFSEYLASERLSKNVFRIPAHGKQGTVKELQESICAATNQTGSLEQCLAKLPAKSTLVFSDIEVWWNRFLEEDALTILIGLIDQFSKKHHFILIRLWTKESHSTFG
ncbi:MAG: hypothetical protein R3E32_03680 [Chitinophagales bacterium]